MLYVDDKLPRHPKIFKAGAFLGKSGPAQALALYMDGLSYAREHLTDGFIPDQFVANCALVGCPLDVAKALADRRVRLWHRVRGGYRIHDYHHWNKNASEIKEKREAERKKKALQRAGKDGATNVVSRDVSPGDNSRTSCARASTIHVPRTTIPDLGRGAALELERGEELGTKSRSVAAPRRPLEESIPNPSPAARAPAPDGNYAVIVRIAHEALESLGTAEPSAEAIARVKDLCAERRIDYGAHPDVSVDVVRRAVESAAAQRVLVPVRRSGRGGQPTSVGTMVDEFRARIEAMRGRVREA